MSGKGPCAVSYKKYGIEGTLVEAIGTSGLTSAWRPRESGQYIYICSGQMGEQGTGGSRQSSEARASGRSMEMPRSWKRLWCRNYSAQRCCSKHRFSVCLFLSVVSEFTALATQAWFVWNKQKNKWIRNMSGYHSHDGWETRIQELPVQKSKVTAPPQSVRQNMML